MMANDIFRTVRELLESRDELLLGNAVNTEGRLYDDSVENLKAILAMQGHHDRMYTALEGLVWNHAQFGRVTDEFVRDVARLLQEIDG